MPKGIQALKIEGQIKATTRKGQNNKQWLENTKDKSKHLTMKHEPN